TVSLALTEADRIPQMYIQRQAHEAVPGRSEIHPFGGDRCLLSPEHLPPGTLARVCRRLRFRVVLPGGTRRNCRAVPERVRRLRAANDPGVCGLGGPDLRLELRNPPTPRPRGGDNLEGTGRDHVFPGGGRRRGLIPRS